MTASVMQEDLQRCLDAGMNGHLAFLTVKSDIEDERRGLELGAADYITKPVSPPDF